MAKADIDLVKHILQRNGLDNRQTAKIIEEINFELKQMVDPDKPPAVKKQFVILVADPEGNLEGKDMVGWVVQVPEEDSPLTAVERITRAAYEYNVTPKGRRIPIKSLGEACEAAPSRILKEQNIWVKTKEPVQVITTINELPLERTGKLSRADLGEEEAEE
ncbi:MAG: hypothetical protein SFY80_02420 [Verrucomicrobiota bacterium]|nr:hypothetical protein [Verrucomicrobiota bacterium]